MLEYLRPDNLEDALLKLTEQPCTLLAGGTDFYPARVGKKITENVLDLSRNPADCAPFRKQRKAFYLVH